MARRLTMAAAALMAAVASSAAAQTAAVQPVEVELHVHRGRPVSYTHLRAHET